MREKYTAIYARVSTDQQRTGLEAQLLANKSYCDQKGIRNFVIFADENVSGAKVSRPSLDELMCEVRKGKVETVIVYSFSRMARSTRHLLDVLAEFNDRGINFISISENVDTNTAMGRAMFTIISAIAQLERELISERVKNGLKNAREKGKQIGRPRKVNEELILELRDKGLSYRKIAKLAKCSLATVCRVIGRQDEAK